MTGKDNFAEMTLFKNKAIMLLYLSCLHLYKCKVVQRLSINDVVTLSSVLLILWNSLSSDNLERVPFIIWVVQLKIKHLPLDRYTICSALYQRCLVSLTKPPDWKTKQSCFRLFSISLPLKKKNVYFFVFQLKPTARSAEVNFCWIIPCGGSAVCLRHPPHWAGLFQNRSFSSISSPNQMQSLQHISAAVRIQIFSFFSLLGAGKESWVRNRPIAKWGSVRLSQQKGKCKKYWSIDAPWKILEKFVIWCIETTFFAEITFASYK